MVLHDDVTPRNARRKVLRSSLPLDFYISLVSDSSRSGFGFGAFGEGRTEAASRPGGGLIGPQPGAHGSSTNQKLL